MDMTPGQVMAHGTWHVHGTSHRITTLSTPPRYAQHGTPNTCMDVPSIKKGDDLRPRL